MATTITKTVKSSGGDYTSRSAWEAGRQGNLPTLDQIEKAEVYAFSDTTSCLIDGWTTDATRYWWIYVPTTERHDGKWNSSKARLEYTATAASQSCFRSLEDYGTLEGDQLSITLNGNTGCRLISFNSQTATNNKQIFKQLVCRNINGGTAMQGGVYTLSANTILIFASCIFYDFDTSAGAYLRDGGASSYFYKCTFQNCTKGIAGLGKTDTITAKNCLFRSCTTPADGTFAAGTDYNATDQASMSYSVTGSGNTHDRVSQTFTFVDEANDDFHLASTDAGAKDYGVDLSGDSVYAFSVDIDNDTISGTWDIGADEYVSSGYTLTAAYGTYTYTGQTATITHDKVISAAAGTYTYTGQSATITHGYVLDAASGTYAYTGQDATLTHGYVLDAANGSYSYVGQDATIAYAPGTTYNLNAAAGSYSVTGQTATILKSNVVTAEPGTYSVSGQSATISYSGAPATQGGAGGKKHRRRYVIQNRMYDLDESELYNVLTLVYNDSNVNDVNIGDIAKSVKKPSPKLVKRALKQAVKKDETGTYHVLPKAVLNDPKYIAPPDYYMAEILAKAQSYIDQMEEEDIEALLLGIL